MLGSAQESFSDAARLAELARQGDGDAFAQLFLSLLPLIGGKVSRLAPRLHGDRDDLLQEGAIGLMDAVAHYDPASGTPFQAYASVCIEHRILSALRAQGRQKNLPLNESVPLDDLEDSSAFPSADPENVFLGRERLRHVLQAVQTHLSPMERQVLEGYLGGRSYREVASRLGLTEKSVDNALQRIRRKLGRAVSPE
ncbi:MAG: sigma-70 family RNA polymerase sigma factor [Firmicutes bacterium]|nr:sigma-70 family RNA polymerase sigma factor [Bacillota bacterium]